MTRDQLTMYFYDTEFPGVLESAHILEEPPPTFSIKAYCSSSSAYARISRHTEEPKFTTLFLVHDLHVSL
jgi:hypothetical protein